MGRLKPHKSPVGLVEMENIPELQGTIQGYAEDREFSLCSLRSHLSFSTHTHTDGSFNLIIPLPLIRERDCSKIQRSKRQEGVSKTGLSLHRKSQEFYGPTLIEFFFLPYCNLPPLIKRCLLWHIMGSFEMQVK